MSSRPTASRCVPTVLLLATVFAGAPLLAAEKPDVHARLVAPASGPAGSRVALVVHLTLGPHWHVNSHTPADAFLIPTELSLTTSAGTLSAVRYPVAVERRFSFSDKPLRVYEGAARFEIDLDLPSHGADEAAIAGSLAYQACNEQQCFAPARIPLEATIRIVAPAKNEPFINQRAMRNLSAVTQ